MLITVLLPGIIKMTLQQHQPVVPAACAVSFSPPSSCCSSHPPSGISSLHSSHALGPPGFSEGQFSAAWGFLSCLIHFTLWGWAGGAGRSRFGWCEAVICCPYGPARAQGTQLCSAGNWLGQCVQATSPSLSLHPMKRLVCTPCFAFLCVLETSINGCGGDGIPAKCVVCCSKTCEFYPHFHSSACDQIPLSVTLVQVMESPWWRF